MNAQFRYPAEKFAAARRALMLPHPKGEAESIVLAFHECELGLMKLPLDELDQNARSWVQTLRELMSTDVIPATSGGTWSAKAERLTEDERAMLSEVVDELAHWFRRNREGS